MQYSTVQYGRQCHYVQRCHRPYYVHSRSVDPLEVVCRRKILQSYIVHMYSMPYYTYGSTANFLFLEPTALIYIYISKERRCNEDQCGIGKFKIERVIR